MFELSQRFHFDAAHTLLREIEAEGSKRVHGHTYHAEVFIQGTPDVATGMVMDLGLVRREIARVRSALDHHLLDEVVGLGIPTLENICAYVLHALQPALPQLCAVRVWRDSVGDGCTLRV
jgi:6-pyruvoyltetrahydropterin/6-carboxytetrahydropterin synthase